MGNHGNKRETAGLNTAGAKREDEPIPVWAKMYFDQQARLLERMNSLVMESSNPKQKKVNVQCYKCGKYGNYARECQSSAPKRQQGGFSVETPPVSQTVPTETPEISKIASTTDDSTIFVNCRVNGYYVKTLVDTGAAVTIMHEDLLARVRTKKTQVRPVTKTILGANNTPLNVTGSAEVDISVCGITVRHDVLICNDLSQVMLIGVDYRKPQRCVDDSEKNKLKIGKNV